MAESSPSTIFPASAKIPKTHPDLKKTFSFTIMVSTAATTPKFVNYART